MKGMYGEFGGQYAPEALMNALNELEESYQQLKDDPSFVEELKSYQKNYEADYLEPILRKRRAKYIEFLQKEDSSIKK